VAAAETAAGWAGVGGAVADAVATAGVGGGVVCVGLRARGRAASTPARGVPARTATLGPPGGPARGVTVPGVGRSGGRGAPGRTAAEEACSCCCFRSS
jgi:hypothetical protein